MNTWMQRLWHETDGVLTFEWTLLTSLVTVGAVAGITAVRDAVNDEMADVTEAMTTLDQSYVIQPPLAVMVHTGGGGGGGGGGYRVQNFNSSNGTSSFSYGNSYGSNFGAGGVSTAAGSAFYDAPSRVTRIRAPLNEGPQHNAPEADLSPAAP